MTLLLAKVFLTAVILAAAVTIAPWTVHLLNAEQDKYLAGRRLRSDEAEARRHRRYKATCYACLILEGLLYTTLGLLLVAVIELR